jgi:hypothetical protein
MRVGIVSAAFGVLAACGNPPPPVTPVAPAPKPSAPVSDDLSGFANAEFSNYRSDRFGVNIPLPDRASWVIADRDDQNAGWVIATHAATSTIVRVRKFEETMLVGRRECELRAQLIGELPRSESVEEARYTTLVDEPLHRPLGWDARRWVAFEPGAGGKLVGHAYLLAGHRHTCLIVHVITEVKSDNEANALADRLELFSSRTLSGVSVDRAKEPDPLLPPPPPKGAP